MMTSQMEGLQSLFGGGGGGGGGVQVIPSTVQLPAVFSHESTCPLRRQQSFARLLSHFP